MTKLNSVLKSKDIILSTDVCVVKSTFFFNIHIWMWELEHKEGWELKNWYFWIMVLEKTLESPLDCKEIKPVDPKGNQPWVFIGRADDEAEAPIVWPPDAKSQHIGRAPAAGKDRTGGGEGNRGWDGWTTLPTQCTWVRANSTRE